MIPKIIKATAQLENQLLTIYQEFINELHTAEPDDLKSRFREFITHTSNHLDLVLENDQTIGFVEYRDVPLKLRDMKQKVEITSLYLRKNFRNKGYGSQIIDHIVQYAKENDRDRIVLYSGLELENAHKFYEAVGFSKKAYFFEMKLT